MTGAGLGLDGLGLFGLGSSDEGGDASLAVLVMTGSGTMPAGVMHGAAVELDAVVMAGSGLMPSASMGGGASLVAVVMTGSALAPVASFSAGASLLAATMTGSALAPSAIFSAGASLIAPLMTGSALAPNGNFGVISDPEPDTTGNGGWDPWAPYETLLLRNAAIGDGSIRIRINTPMDDLPIPFRVHLGREIAEVSARAIETWTLTDPLTEPHYADSRVIHQTIKVVADSIEYTGQLLSLRDKEDEHGEVEATWEIETSDPVSWTPTLDPTPAAFTLYSNESGEWRAFFGGRMGRVTNLHRPFDDSHHLVLTGRGSIVTANWDGYDGSHIWDAYTPARQIIIESCGEHASFISASFPNAVDGGQSTAQPLDGIGQSPRHLWDNLIAKGDAGYPYSYYGRTDDDGGQNLHVLLHQRQPLIKIPLTSIKPPTLAWDVERLRTKVVVKWQSGYASATSGGATRWRYFDFSSQIDNYDLALQVAKAYLALSSTFEAISDGQIDIEWPKPVYGADGVTKIVQHRIRSGWRAQIVDFDAGGLPIGTFRIVAKEADHFAHTVSLNLGAREEDFDLSSQFIGKETKLLGSPVSTLIPLVIAPPGGVPQGVGQATIGAGASGRAGYGQVADDADMSTIWFAINELVDGTHADDGSAPFSGILKAWTYFKNPIPIDVQMSIRGLRLKASDDANPPGPAGTLSVSVTRGTVGAFPALGDMVGDIALSGVYEAKKNFPEHPVDSLEQTANNVFKVDPDEYLLVTVDASPAPDLFTGGMLGILVQRREGSSRGALAGAPTVGSTSASRDASNNTTFLVTADQQVHLQIEYGETTSYGQMSRFSEQLHRVASLTVSGLPPAIHYRAHVFNKDGIEGIGSDQTV